MGAQATCLSMQCQGPVLRLATRGLPPMQSMGPTADLARAQAPLLPLHSQGPRPHPALRLATRGTPLRREPPHKADQARMLARSLGLAQVPRLPPLLGGPERSLAQGLVPQRSPPRPERRRGRS